MARERKTLDVQAVKAGLNNLLTTETLHFPPNYDSDAYRAGICVALENILHDANAYKGFRYADGWPAANANGTEHKRTYL